MIVVNLKSKKGKKKKRKERSTHYSFERMKQGSTDQVCMSLNLSTKYISHNSHNPAIHISCHDTSFAFAMTLMVPYKLALEPLL